jgi:hypothetical protein
VNAGDRSREEVVRSSKGFGSCRKTLSSAMWAIWKDLQYGEMAMAKMVKCLAVFVLASLLGASVAGAASEIVYPSFMWGETWNALFLNELKEGFQKENPGVTVNGINVPISAFWDKQYTDVTAGNPPDIVTLFDPHIVTFLEAGLLEPLNPYLEKAGFSLKDFVPTAAVRPDIGGVNFVRDEIARRSKVEGAVIMEVDRDSRAYDQGLRGLFRDNFGRLLIRDVITAVDQMKVRSYDDLFGALDGYKIGDTVTLTVEREGKARQVRIQLVGND